MESLNITNNEKEQQFEVRLEDELAILQYRSHDGLLFLMHTEVPDNLAGRGIASALAAHAFEYARDHGAKVKVYCPFVVNYLKRHPEYADLVQK